MTQYEDGKPTEALLSIRGLRTSFGSTEVLHGVDLEIRRGEVMTLIGESGSGKSVLARSILGLAGKNACTTGEILFDGKNLIDLSEPEMHAVRGADIGIIVQDAMAALNPMRTIGYQLCETIAYRHPDYRNGTQNKAALIASSEVKALALEFLKRVGITAPERRMQSYAHQLSGGMRQRVMIALALVGAPKLLIADEPTTALDVVVQREILKQLREIVKNSSMSMLLVTHDLHLARDVADRVTVMYAGHILETGPVARVLPNPAHPYTEGLLDAMPDMESEKGTLQPIKGEIPPPDKLGHGCPFAGRCPLTRVQCRMTLPAMQSIESGWTARCTEAHCHEAQLEQAFKAQEEKRDQSVVKNLSKMHRFVQAVQEEHIAEAAAAASQSPEQNTNSPHPDRGKKQSAGSLRPAAATGRHRVSAGNGTGRTPLHRRHRRHAAAPGHSEQSGIPLECPAQALVEIYGCRLSSPAQRACASSTDITQTLPGANMPSRITLHFIGMDDWNRAVFASSDRQSFFKSVALMPHPDFHSLPESVKETLLHSLHDTDSPDGEPGWPVSRESVQWMP